MDVERNAASPGPFAWLLISPADTPEEWRHRAQPMNLVPLLPEELARLSREPEASEGDDELLRLVARGVVDGADSPDAQPQSAYS